MTWILRISTLLNLGLLMGVALILRRPATGQSEPAPTVTAEEPPSANLNNSLTPTEIYTTNAFHWDRLESTNYQEFAANLRQVHCPELTIRDIIFADAERRYGELEYDNAESLPFWLAGRARAAASRRNQAERTTAQAALTTELSQLFGVEWAPEENELHEIHAQALARMLVGPVSDAQFEQALRWFLATMQQHESFRSSRQNLLLGDDLSAWADLIQERRTRLEQALGPASFQEMQARTSFIEEVFDKKALHVKELDLTPAELRQLCLLKVREIGWLDEIFHLEQNLSSEEQEDRQLAFVAQAQQVMSPDHYEEFVRIQDDDYREILTVARNNELPRSVAQQVYQMQQLATAEFERLRTTPDDPDAVAAAAALQITVVDSIRKLMGDSAFKTYTNRHGNWVREFSKK